ncbi:hypothetical protein [Paraburkholderia adhaesiva]|uniref:hypothetical protein n=1 Tax=Paraburkholderia adhaesiva TaxID=2883244 RepID=UPI001F380C66|nr:hypothetical protein [Paraburkholderia adhaesiva]
MEYPRPPVITFTKSLFAALFEHVSLNELATALRELPPSTCARLLRLAAENDAEQVGHIVIHTYNQVIAAKKKQLRAVEVEQRQTEVTNATEPRHRMFRIIADD